MDLKKLKHSVRNNNLSDSMIVFLSDNKYLIKQYIDEIARIKNLNINYIETIDGLLHPSLELFEISNDNLLNILYTDDFKCTDKLALSLRNLIIITKKISDEETKELFSENIIEIPEIPKWCIKDYVYSKLTNCDNSAKDYLLDLCNYELPRLDLEIEKILVFNKKQQNDILKRLIKEDCFNDLSLYNIFDFTNALLCKDKSKLKNILFEFSRIDIEAIGVVKILTQNFEKLLSIKLDKNATPERVGMSQKQFYAVSRNLNIYGDNALLKMYQFLTSIDKELKSGNMPVNNIIDFIVINLFS